MKFYFEEAIKIFSSYIKDGRNPSGTNLGRKVRIRLKANVCKIEFEFSSFLKFKSSLVSFRWNMRVSDWLGRAASPRHMRPRSRPAQLGHVHDTLALHTRMHGGASALLANHAGVSTSRTTSQIHT